MSDWKKRATSVKENNNGTTQISDWKSRAVPAEEEKTSPPVEEESFKAIPGKEAGLAFASGASLGLAPALEAAGENFLRPFKGEDFIADPAKFKEEVSQAREKYDVAREQYPGQFSTIEMLSSVPTSIAASKLLPTASSIPARLGKTAGEGILGAAQATAQGASPLEGAILGAAPDAVAATYKMSNPLLKSGVKAITPARSKKAVETFIDNPELLKKAEKAPVEGIPNAEKAVIDEAGKTEQALQKHLDAEQAKIADLYESAGDIANKSQDLVENPLEMESQKIRDILKELSNNPDMSLYRNSLNEVAEKVGVQTPAGMINPISFSDGVPVTKVVPTKGDNLTMSLEMRKRLDDLVVPPTQWRNLTAEERMAQKRLLDKRKEINEIIAKGKEYDPAAHKIVTMADKMFSKYRTARDVIEDSLASSSADLARRGQKTDKIVDQDLISAVKETSPQKQVNLQGALQDVDQGTVLTPLQEKVKEVDKLKDLSALEGTLGVSDKIPFVNAIPVISPKANVKGVQLLQKGMDMLETGKTGEVLRGTQRAVTPALLNKRGAGAHNDYQKEEVIKTNLKNPLAQAWVKIVSRNPARPITQKSLVEIARKYEEDPQKLEETLKTLGMTVSP